MPGEEPTMDEKTPRERLRESLRENAERVSQLPDWVRAAISTAAVFSVPPVTAEPRRADDKR